jgi:hypothetical protein
MQGQRVFTLRIPNAKWGEGFCEMTTSFGQENCTENFHMLDYFSMAFILELRRID